MSDPEFGVLPDGRPVRRLVVGTPPGPVLHLLDLGATAHRLEVTDAEGGRRNVLLGLPTPEAYLASTDYLGGTIGRYANRIAGGTFEVEGRRCTLAPNDRGNNVHGGPDGFDRRLWTVADRGPSYVELALESPDGDQGFPGRLRAVARFTVSATAVEVVLTATTDAPTVVNLTSHAYFHLDGAGSGPVDDHLLTVAADEYTPVDATGIPLGDHAPVAGTPFDLRMPTVVGAAVRADHPQARAARGFDHNYVLSGGTPAAVLASPRSGIRMELRTDQPGLQVYTGNGLDGTALSVDGASLRQGDGIALEPQLFPDTPNRPEFGTAVLRPGATYSSVTVWEFGTVSGRRGGS